VKLGRNEGQKESKWGGRKCFYTFIYSYENEESVERIIFISHFEPITYNIFLVSEQIISIFIRILASKVRNLYFQFFGNILSN